MYNRTLGQMNRDRALARRQATERLINPPPLPHCAKCGGIVGHDEPRVFELSRRRGTKAFHWECFEERAQEGASGE
jgi:hypothetical protein